MSLEKWSDESIRNRKDAEAALDQFRQAIREAMRNGLEGKALLAKLAGGLHGRQEAAKPLTFRQVAVLYLEKGVRDQKLRSADQVEYRLNRLTDHFGDRLLADIKAADLQDFLADLRKPAKLIANQKTERARKPATVNRFRAVLVQLFSFAVVREYLPASPFDRRGGKSRVPALKENNKRDRRLFPDEEARLLKQANPTLRNLIVVALKTGLRRDELLTLTWADLAAKPGKIRVRAENAKSDRDRYVPVHPEVQAIFDFLRTDANGDDKPSNGRVLSNEVGEPIKSIRTAWTKACERAGIHGLNFHDLRHEFASRLHDQGTPLGEVQKLLGHSSIVTTMRYVTPKEDQMQAAVLRLSASPDISQAQPAPAEGKSDRLSQIFHTHGVSHDPRRARPTSNPQIS